MHKASAEKLDRILIIYLSFYWEKLGTRHTHQPKPNQTKNRPYITVLCTYKWKIYSFATFSMYLVLLLFALPFVFNNLLKTLEISVYSSRPDLGMVRALVRNTLTNRDTKKLVFKAKFDLERQKTAHSTKALHMHIQQKFIEICIGSNIYQISLHPNCVRGSRVESSGKLVCATCSFIHVIEFMRCFSSFLLYDLFIRLMFMISLVYSFPIDQMLLPQRSSSSD